MACAQKIRVSKKQIARFFERTLLHNQTKFMLVTLAMLSKEQSGRAYIDVDAGSGISLDWGIICWHESEKVFHCSRVVDAVPFDRM